MTKLNTLEIFNQDADKLAMTVAFCGKVELSTEEIRSFLLKLRDCPVMDNVVVDFGAGHVAKMSSVAFGGPDVRIAKEQFLATQNEARVGVTPHEVPQAREATSEESFFFFKNQE